MILTNQNLINITHTHLYIQVIENCYNITYHSLYGGVTRHVIEFILFFFITAHNNTTLLLQKFPTASHLLTNRNRKYINIHPIELSIEINFFYLARLHIDPY